MGRGVAQDYTQAVFWYRKAAEQGDASAQDGLGEIYDNGYGVRQDYAQAVAWYRKAAVPATTPTRVARRFRPRPRRGEELS